MQCTIHINTLIAAPYNLVGGDSVYATVVATNIYGDSAQSEAGNGAYYTTVPFAPVDLAEDITHRSATTLGLMWSVG